MVEAGRQVRRQEASPEDEWRLSYANVQALAPKWPVIKVDAIDSLDKKMHIGSSWLSGIASRLLRAKLIAEEVVTDNPGRRNKGYGARATFFIGLVAQSLKDHGLIYIATPQRDAVINEAMEVIKTNRDKLCSEY